MKKIKQLFAVFMICLTCITTAVACFGKDQVESITVKSGLREVYYKGEQVDFNNLKVNVTYKDGTVETVGKDQLTIGDFSTQTVGNYNVTIAYKDKTITVKLKVSNNKDEVYDIINAEHNKNIVQYENVFKTPGSSVDTESLFVDRVMSDDTIYVVGDDNAFIYNLQVNALDTEGLPVSGGLQASKTVSTVYYKETYLASEYTKLTDTQLSDYVTIDDEVGSYHFLQQGYYKLEVRPYYLSETQLLEASVYTKTLEFKVVDGYNITTAKQLGILNNVSEITKYSYKNNENEEIKASVNLYEKWGSLLEDAGIEQQAVNAIVLHNDITITPEDIPEDYFESPSYATNSDEHAETINPNALYTDKNGNKKVLVDHMESDKCTSTTIYCHEVETNSTFKFYGNFFTIKADLPTVDLNILSADGSHTTLFKFVSTHSNKENSNENLGANYETALAAATNTKIYIYNLNTIGNAARTDSTKPEDNPTSAHMGGLIFVKAPAVTLTIKNTIVKAYLTNFHLEERLATLNLDSVKSYDAYQSIIYSFNGYKLNITNSDLQRAGGPVILMNNSQVASEKRVATTIVIEDTYMESYVSGLEPWFAAQNKVDTATGLKSMNSAVYNPLYNSTFLKLGADQTTELSNALIFNLNTSDDTTAQSIVHITIDNKVVMDTLGMNSDEPNFDTAKTLIYNYSQLGRPVLGPVMATTDNRAVGALPGYGGSKEEIFMETNGGSSYAIAEDMTASSTENDYLTIYTPGMSLVVGYYYSPVPMPTE